MKRALEGDSTDVLPVHKLDSKMDYLYKFKTLYYKQLGKNYHRLREISINKKVARKAEKQIKNIKPDIIFSSGSLELAHIDTNIPLTFWSDATFHNIVDYYPEYSNLAKETLESGDYLERLSLQKSRLQFFATDWSRQDSIDYYNSDPAKIFSFPFGANIKEEPDYDDIKQKIQSKKFDKINFLFVGVDWYRKGGDIVIKLIEKLRASGVNAHLQVVGCQPPIETNSHYIENFGYLNKSIPEEYSKLKNLYLNAHFFTIPSRFEQFGVVVCEANSMGLPVLGAKTGGLQHIVKDSINGFSVDYNNIEYSLDTISKNLIGLLSEKKDYIELALSSLNEYRTNLNWKVSGQKILQKLKEIV